VMHRVCDPVLPDAGEVWDGVVEDEDNGGRAWWRLCSGYCNYIISRSDLDNTEVRSPAERHAAMSWAPRLQRVFKIDKVN